MATLTATQKEVIRKIIYAVETGGQVYGKQNYSSLIGAGANCDNEKAITIGAGQWYAGEALTLLKLIQKDYPTQFKELDIAGISNSFDNISATLPFPEAGAPNIIITINYLLKINIYN